MEKDSGVEIKEIVLNIGKKEIKLTPDECKKLKALLEEIFDKEVVKEVVRTEHIYHYPYQPYWYYAYPGSTNLPVTYCGEGSVTTTGSTLYLTVGET